ncbi:hypothetical protein Tco_0634897, partial [Tanacetum coccineum]
LFRGFVDRPILQIEGGALEYPDDANIDPNYAESPRLAKSAKTSTSTSSKSTKSPKTDTSISNSAKKGKK